MHKNAKTIICSVVTTCIMLTSQLGAEAYGVAEGGYIDEAVGVTETADENICRHRFSSWHFVKKPTCTKDGEKTRSCAICGEVESVKLNRLGHKFATKQVQPDFLHNGYSKHTCKRCGYVYKDTYVDKNTLRAPKDLDYASQVNSVKLSWSKVLYADGYRVYMYSGGKWRKVATVKSGSAYKIAGLRPGKYKFRVGAYVRQSGKVVSGKNAACTAVTKPKSVKLISAAAKKSTATVSWKTEDCSGYEVYIRHGANWKRVKTLAKGSKYKITGLKKATSYKVKVRAFFTDSDGGRQYGEFSRTLNFKTKK